VRRDVEIDGPAETALVKAATGLLETIRAEPVPPVILALAAQLQDALDQRRLDQADAPAPAALRRL